MPNMVSNGNTAAAAAAAAVHSHKLSTVVPGSVTGDNVVYEFADMDLVMKLHYLRGVYLFKASDVVEGLGIKALKEPMFPMLDVYYPVAGRIRRSDSGRPRVRCNDSGVRIIEARCDKTVEEWLAMKEDVDRDRALVSDKVLGPDLAFSPFVYIQFTKFECGGMAVGFSWAHVLGDAVSCTNCINLWGQLLSGNKPANSTHGLPNTRNEAKQLASLPETVAKPLPVKQVEPVGDCWLSKNNCTMGTFSFQIAETKLNYMQSHSSDGAEIPTFEVLTALFWRCLAKIRQGREPRTVTVCRTSEVKSGILSNDQIISTITSEASPATMELAELAMLIAEEREDRKKEIEGMVDRGSGQPDFILYGANLTFVDLEQAGIYGLELKGQKPVYVGYSMDGVGDEGAILVFPNPDGKAYSSGGEGRTVTVILPTDQISQIRELLEVEWSIV